MSIDYTHGWDDFAVSFPAPGLNERDAERHSITVGGKFWWDRRKRNVSVSYTYRENNAEGVNFDYESHGVNARLESHLLGPIWGAVDIGYQENDYRGFISTFIPPPGRNEMEIFNVGAQLIWVINRQWSVDVFYQFIENTSNQPQFESDSHNVGGGITFKF
ncbi:MAG: hypothetical protein CMJ49_08085 [Planctomycetaceae bacterium]|nr:hypothetical protein [Planctomycetaceae bacterium]